MKDINSLFRPSKSENRTWNLTKTLIQTSFFWILFLYLIPTGIFLVEQQYNWISFSPNQEMGWLLFALFGLIGLASGATMSYKGQGTPLPLDCPNQLVIQGPYKYVRNPMAVAGIGQGICVGIIFGSYLIIAYSIIGAFLWHFLVRPIEENDLQDRFGQAYTNYKSRTKCWVPSFK